MSAVESIPSGQGMSAPASNPDSVNLSYRIRNMSRESAMICIVAVAAICGHLPLLVEHFSDLMLRPHYQFVLALPVGIVLLTMQRWRSLVPSKPRDVALTGGDGTEPYFSPGKLQYSVPLVILALVVLAAAVWIWSARVAMIAAMLTAFGLMFAIGGRELLRVTMPAWLLTWLALPPPFNRDYWLISQLRDVTTRWASRVLDQIGVLHLVNGNILELPGQKLFVADACSGIHSLYVLLAFALFIGLYLRRRAIHIALLLLSTFGIVLFENVLRITGVAEGVHLGFDISTGWRHSMFGAVLFVLSLMLVFTTDQFFAFLLPEKLFRIFRRRKGTRDSQAVANESGVQHGSASERRVGLGLLPFGIAFAMLGVVQLGLMPAHASQTSKFLSGYPFGFSGLDKAELPANWTGWTQAATMLQTRDQDDPLGAYSQIWRYEKGNIVAEVSVDYPYQTPHNLATCYANIGWQMHRRAVIEPDKSSEAEANPVAGAPFAMAMMEKPLYGHALLLYTSHDTENGEGTAVCQEAQSFAELLRIRVSTPPCFQVQLIATSAAAIDDAQQQELQQLFLHLRQILVPVCLSNLQK